MLIARGEGRGGGRAEYLPDTLIRLFYILDPSFIDSQFFNSSPPHTLLMATDPPSRHSMHHVIHIPYDPPRPSAHSTPPPPPEITAEEIYTKILKNFLI